MKELKLSFSETGCPMLYIYSIQQTLMTIFVEMLPFTYHFQSQQ